MQLYNGIGFIAERPMTLGLLVLAMILVVLPGYRGKTGAPQGGGCRGRGLNGLSRQTAPGPSRNPARHGSPVQLR